MTAVCSHIASGNRDSTTGTAAGFASVCLHTAAANTGTVSRACCSNLAAGDGNSGSAHFISIAAVSAAAAADTGAGMASCRNNSIVATNCHIGRLICATTNTGTAARGCDCTTANDNMLFPAVTVRTTDGCTATALVS